MAKSRWLMTEQEKADEVRARIKRAATTMYNACKKSCKENNCTGCPFKTHGCSLYGHPIEWEDKMREFKP